LSKAIQKPSQLAAVENAARVIGNTVETSLQAGCEVVRLQAGCELAPLQAGCSAPLQAACTAPLQAGCVQVRAPEETLLAGCVVDGPIVIRAQAPEESLLAGCITDGVNAIQAKK